MNDKLMWSVEVDNKASGTISKIDKEINQLTGSTTSLSRETEKQGKASTSAMGALSQLGLAAQGLQTVYNAVIGTTKELVQAQLEQLQVDQQLEFAFRQRGLSAAEAADQMVEAQERFAEVQRSTIYGDEAQGRALTTLLHVIDDVDQAYEDLSITIDLAAMSGQKLEQVSQTMARARTGDIAGLRRLNVLRKDEIDLLNSIEDSAKRAEIAIGMVEERTRGSAEAVNEHVQALAQWENDWGDVKQAMGEMALALMGIGAATLEAVTGAEKGQHTMQNWAKSISDGSKDVEVGRQAISHIAQELGAAELAAVAFQTVLSGDSVGWTSMVEGPVAYLDNLHEAAKRKDLEKSRVEAEKLRLELEELARTNPIQAWEVDKMMEGFDPVIPEWNVVSFDPLTEERLRQAGIMLEEEDAKERERDKDRRKREAEKLAAARQASRNRIELAEQDLKILYASNEIEKIKLNRDRSILQIKQRGLELEEENLLIRLEQERAENRIAEVREKDSEDQKKRNELALAGLSVLTAKDDLVRAEMEKRKALLELSHQELTDDEKKFQNARIELEYQQTLAQIEQDRIRERERAESEAHRARMSALRDEVSEQQRLSSIVGGSFGSMGETGGAFDSLVSSLQGVSTQYQLMEAQGMAASAALSQSAHSGAHATAMFLEEMGVGYRVIAGIRAAIETASSISAFAIGNVPSGIAHATAAGIFGAQAGGVGASGSSGSTGVSASAQAAKAPDMDQAFQAQKRAHLEALREHQQGGRELVQIIDQRGSTFFERDPVSRRRASQMIAEDSRLSIGGGR